MHGTRSVTSSSSRQFLRITNQDGSGTPIISSIYTTYGTSAVSTNEVAINPGTYRIWTFSTSSNTTTVSNSSWVDRGTYTFKTFYTYRIILNSSNPAATTGQVFETKVAPVVD